MVVQFSVFAANTQIHPFLFANPCRAVRIALLGDVFFVAREICE